MNRKTARLVLGRETMRRLTVTQLELAQGAAIDSPGGTIVGGGGGGGGTIQATAACPATSECFFTVLCTLTCNMACHTISQNNCSGL